MATDPQRTCTNPFRKVAARIAVGTATIGASDAPAAKKPVKKVRVQSPPVSPDMQPDSQPWTRGQSPPPLLASSSVNDRDRFVEPRLLESTPLRLNPFDRTLRDINQNLPPVPTSPQDVTVASASMNVDSFREMLLTGVAPLAQEAAAQTEGEARYRPMRPPLPQIPPLPPLPPLPPSILSKPVVADQQRDGQMSTNTDEEVGAPVPRKTEPPPIPRRQSGASIQLAGEDELIGRSGRSSMDSTRSRTDSLRLAAPPPPPPPPPRRPASRKSGLSPSIQAIISPPLSPYNGLLSPTSILESEPWSPGGDLRHHSTFPVIPPPLPPARQGSLRRGSTAGFTASPVLMSQPRLNVTGSLRDQPTPPPLPPPRKRGSSRGSFDDGMMGRSIALRAGAQAAADPGKGVDILADLHALQKEVDYFRAGLGGGGGSKA